MSIYRHGDLIIKPGKARVELSTKAEFKNESFVVAEGETTGHAHRLRGAFNIFEGLDGRSNRQYFVDVLEPSVLTHEEHGSITVDPGSYVIDRERELDTRGEAYSIAD